MSNIETKVREIIEDSISHMGFSLVRISMLGGRGHATLQIMADKADGGLINIDECAEISRTVSALLDVHDPIKSEYRLEVSSAGIDRPLVRAADFERWKGFDAKIETALMIDNRRRFKGKLLGLRDENVLIETEGQEYEVPMANIAKAKLELTDELIKSYQKKEAQDE